MISLQAAYAMDTVFDSMDKATEVKLAPAIKTSTTQNTQNVNSVYKTSIKEQKFNSALLNLSEYFSTNHMACDTRRGNPSKTISESPDIRDSIISISISSDTKLPAEIVFAISLSGGIERSIAPVSIYL